MSYLTHKETLEALQSLVKRQDGKKTLLLSRTRLSMVLRLAEKAHELETNRLETQRYYKRILAEKDEELKELKAEMEHYKNLFYRHRGAVGE